MKRALLVHAQLRFSEMKLSRGQQQSTGTMLELAAPISPSPHLIINTCLPLLDLNSDSFLIDLGCGDGRWMIAATERAGCRCLGIDVDPERLSAAQEAIQEKELQERVEVRHKDVFAWARDGDELHEADVLVVYLFREAVADIGPTLRRRLVAGTRRVLILSVGFALPGWTCVREEKFGGLRVYLYSTR